MTERPLSELGQLLEEARKRADGVGITGREAARRSFVSESRYRQIIRGEGGRAPASTVVTVSLGVGADPAEALRAAGLPADDAIVKAHVEAAQRRTDESRSGTHLSGLAGEIDRVNSLPLPPAEKIQIAQALIRMYEERSQEPERAEPV